MPAVLTFTRNDEEGQMHVVLNQIVRFERDEFNEGTRLYLLSGESVVVKESVAEVRNAIERT